MSDQVDGPVESGTSDGDEFEDDVPDDELPPPKRWIKLLEWFDQKVYILVGVTFLVAALLSLVYGLFYLGDSIVTTMFLPDGISLQAIFTKEAGATDIIDLVSNLLLTLIIMEVLGTVVHHLKDGETTLRPFLFIGIISATRGILAVGARLSVSAQLKEPEFINDMVELGVDAIVIIALGVTMNLIGRFLEEGAIPKHRHKRKAGRQGGNPGSLQPTAAGISSASAPAAFGVRSLFFLMVLIILVALTLIGVLITQGHL